MVPRSSMNVRARESMVAMMALFGQSLVSAMKNPFYLVLAIAIWAGMYFASRHFCKKHEID
jgi:hypothetical protein